MKGNTNKALLASLGVHIALVLVVSPLIVRRSIEVTDSFSLYLLKTAPIRSIRKHLPRPHRLSPLAQAKAQQTDSPSRSSPSYALQVPLSKVPIHADVAATVITPAKVTETVMPAAQDANLRQDTGAAGPVDISVHRGIGAGMFGRSSRGTGIGTHKFAALTQVEDLDSIDLGGASMGLGILNSEMRSEQGASMGLGIFSTVVMSNHGLVGEVYVPGGAISRMPIFEDLTPVYTFVTPNLDVPTRNYTQGFPTRKMKNVIEDFAIRFRGILVVDTSGRYTFGLFSDDGAKLYINGNLVVDNDGVHPARYEWGSTTLDAGPHPVEIHYFQGPQSEIALQWIYQPPYSREQIVPPERIFLPSK